MLRRLKLGLIFLCILWAVTGALGEESLAFTEKSLTVFAGDGFQLPLNRSAQGVTLVSSDSKIASVDEDGWVTPHKKGSVTLTAAQRTESGKIQRASLRLTVKRRVDAITAETTRLFLPLGKSRSLEAQVVPSHASDRTILYASSDERVAAVSKRGKITAQGLGQCVITLQSRQNPEIILACQVTVVNPVTSVSLDVEKNASLWVGETYQLAPAYEPADASYPAFTYLSKNEKVATVDAQGLVTAVGRGTATLVVKAADGSGQSAQCRLTVRQQPTQITLKWDSLKLNPGESRRLPAAVLPKNNSDSRVVWSSTDEAVATVSERGGITALGPGQCRIICRSLNFPEVWAACALDTFVPMTHLSFAADRITLSPGETYQADYLFEPEDATDRAMIWRSGNEAVATVDGSGLITAGQAGHTAVSVQSPDKKSLNAALLVTVTQGIGSLSLMEEALTLAPGESQRLHAVITPRNAQGDLIWFSSDEQVAAVSAARSTARLTAQGTGSCVVTVATADGLLSAQASVTVK